MGLHNKAKLNNEYVSCGYCRLGVFKAQPHSWVTGRVIGISHNECIAAAAKTAEIGQVAR